MLLITTIFTLLMEELHGIEQSKMLTVQFHKV